MTEFKLSAEGVATIQFAAMDVFTHKAETPHGTMETMRLEGVTSRYAGVLEQLKGEVVKLTRDGEERDWLMSTIFVRGENMRLIFTA